jgi:rare lipoprotein A
VVRVNDRGPFARGRILDLSHAAAEALGMIDAGETQVALHHD